MTVTASVRFLTFQSIYFYLTQLGMGGWTLCAWLRFNVLSWYAFVRNCSVCLCVLCLLYFPCVSDCVWVGFSRCADGLFLRVSDRGYRVVGICLCPHHCGEPGGPGHLPGLRWGSPGRHRLFQGPLPQHPHLSSNVGIWENHSLLPQQPPMKLRGQNGTRVRTIHICVPKIGPETISVYHRMHTGVLTTGWEEREPWPIQRIKTSTSEFEEAITEGNESAPEPFERQHVRSPCYNILFVLFK